MHSNITREKLDRNPSPAHSRFASSSAPTRSPQDTRSALEAIDAIRAQSEILRYGQMHTNDAISDIFNRPKRHDNGIVEPQELLHRIEGHLQTLIAEDAALNDLPSTELRGSNAQEAGPSICHDQSRGNDDAPHPVETGSEDRGHDSRLPLAGDHASGDPVIDHAAPVSSDSTRLALVQQMYEILSHPEHPAAPLPVEHPPPLISVTYRPAPKPRSVSTVSLGDAAPWPVPFLPPPAGVLSRPRRHTHRPPREPIREIVPENDIKSPEDAELEREVQRVRTERLLAIDRAAVDRPPPGTSSQPPPQRQSVGLERGPLTSNGAVSGSRAQDVHGPRSNILRGIPEGRMNPTSHTDYVVRQARNPDTAERVAPTEAVQTGQQSSSWYHTSSHRPPSPHSRPQPTLVQFPPEPLNQAIELMQDIRRGQQAAAEQQREVTRYMRDLNGWLGRTVHERKVELGEMDRRVGRLQGDIHHFGRRAQ
ncbi:hypothetical protein FPV67DRAFT_1672757 [Lyophyllum atratum]|nr:hypothetical protein FPV67DRAFT_1672757 [Lyophyllum atratum]